MSAVSHMPTIISPSVPPYLQQLESAASSPTHTDTLMMSSAPDLVPPVVQTCHTGDAGGGIDSPPPVLLVIICQLHNINQKKI